MFRAKTLRNLFIQYQICYQRMTSRPDATSKKVARNQVSLHPLGDFFYIFLFYDIFSLQNANVVIRRTCSFRENRLEIYEVRRHFGRHLGCVMFVYFDVDCMYGEEKSKLSKKSLDNNILYHRKQIQAIT